MKLNIKSQVLAAVLVLCSSAPQILPMTSSSSGLSCLTTEEKNRQCIDRIVDGMIASMESSETEGLSTKRPEEKAKLRLILTKNTESTMTCALCKNKLITTSTTGQQKAIVALPCDAAHIFHHDCTKKACQDTSETEFKCPKCHAPARTDALEALELIDATSLQFIRVIGQLRQSTKGSLLDFPELPQELLSAMDNLIHLKLAEQPSLNSTAQGLFADYHPPLLDIFITAATGHFLEKKQSMLCTALVGLLNCYGCIPSSTITHFLLMLTRAAREKKIIFSKIPSIKELVETLNIKIQISDFLDKEDIKPLLSLSFSLLTHCGNDEIKPLCLQLTQGIYVASRVKEHFSSLALEAMEEEKFAFKSMLLNENNIIRTDAWIFFEVLCTHLDNKAADGFWQLLFEEREWLQRQIQQEESNQVFALICLAIARLATKVSRDTAVNQILPLLDPAIARLQTLNWDEKTYEKTSEEVLLGSSILLLNGFLAENQNNIDFYIKFRPLLNHNLDLTSCIISGLEGILATPDFERQKKRLSPAPQLEKGILDALAIEPDLLQALIFRGGSSLTTTTLNLLAKICLAGKDDKIYPYDLLHSKAPSYSEDKAAICRTVLTSLRREYVELKELAQRNEEARELIFVILRNVSALCPDPQAAYDLWALLEPMLELAISPATKKNTLALLIALTNVAATTADQSIAEHISQMLISHQDTLAGLLANAEDDEDHPALCVITACATIMSVANPATRTVVWSFLAAHQGKFIVPFLTAPPAIDALPLFYGIQRSIQERVQPIGGLLALWGVADHSDRLINQQLWTILAQHKLKLQELLGTSNSDLFQIRAKEALQPLLLAIADRAGDAVRNEIMTEFPTLTKPANDTEERSASGQDQEPAE